MYGICEILPIRFRWVIETVKVGPQYNGQHLLVSICLPWHFPLTLYWVCLLVPPLPICHLCFEKCYCSTVCCLTMQHKFPIKKTLPIFFSFLDTQKKFTEKITSTHLNTASITQDFYINSSEEFQRNLFFFLFLFFFKKNQSEVLLFFSSFIIYCHIKDFSFHLAYMIHQFAENSSA